MIKVREIAHQKLVVASTRSIFIIGMRHAYKPQLMSTGKRKNGDENAAKSASVATYEDFASCKNISQISI